MSDRLCFSYSRSLAPMMWVFVALASIELFVVHFLVSIWSVPAALLLSVLTLASIAWLVLLIRSFGHRPVVLERDALLFRAGTAMAVRVDLSEVEAVRRHFPSEALKRPSVLSFAIMSYPNVLVDLRAPVPHGRRRKPVDSLAHCLDDPAGFAAAVERRLDGGQAE